jgi:hypothetical protein
MICRKEINTFCHVFELIEPPKLNLSAAGNIIASLASTGHIL